MSCAKKVSILTLIGPGKKKKKKKKKKKPKEWEKLIKYNGRITQKRMHIFRPRQKHLQNFYKDNGGITKQEDHVVLIAHPSPDIYHLVSLFPQLS